MAKKKSSKKKAVAKKKVSRKSAVTAVDEADGVKVGEEPGPGMKLRAICRGHTGTIGRIAWSPCGRFIASPSKDKTIRIWDANGGKCIAVLKGHSAAVSCVDWAPNGKMLASGSADKSVQVWNLRGISRLNVEEQGSNDDSTHATVHGSEKMLKGHAGTVHSLSWASDSTSVASGGSSDGSVRVWNIATEQAAVQLKAHTPAVNCVAWSSREGILAVADDSGTIRLWNTVNGTVVKELKGHSDWVASIDWSPNGRLLASGSNDNTVRIWNTSNQGKVEVIEGHTSNVGCVRFSENGKLLGTQSSDGTLRIWRTDTLVTVAKLGDQMMNWQSGFAFHPSKSEIASPHRSQKSILIWELDHAPFFRVEAEESLVRYTSAKIVLVGESNVGKSCLAMRLAEDRYPEDHEHGTTHGMRFWPMEAEELHPAAKPPEGQRRDVVLWDFGGQDEYQLVHQMFLQDTTLALILIDPTRGQKAFDEARDWNKRLEKHLGEGKAVKLLVGAQVDDSRRSKLIDLNSIEELKEECDFAAFLDLSAMTGRNTKKLRKLISNALDWDRMAKTSRPELFQHIRDEIEDRRKKKQIVLTLDTFKKGIKKSAVNLYEEAAVDAVSDQLATQGIIVRTKLAGGDEALVLQLPVIERYAGSLIIAARNNPRGIPVLEERLLGSTNTIPLPGMTKKERLSPARERMVLECIVELMIKHGLCFRHGGLLVFPTLFPAGGADDEKLPHSVSLYYDFTGAIDSIYASLVSKLMVSEEFGEGRLRAGCVEFERGRQGICGVHQIKRPGGLARLDLFFSERTKAGRKDLFKSFVEEHLRLHGVDIREHRAIKCPCGEEITQRIVEENISRGESDVVCPVCREKILIEEGVNRIRERSPKTAEEMVALRKTIDEKLEEDIESAKRAVAGDIIRPKTGDPIRILHLSDLHFTGKTNPDTKLRLLLQDIQLQDDQYPEIPSVEYLVISGDMTDKGSDAGFEKARQFVASLIKELGLSTQRCIFVPGNHDVQDRADAYEEREGEDGKMIRVRHPENFPKRFEQFSDGFFHPLVQKDYPLNYEEQGISYLFPDTGIQFLTLNSAWEIDKNGRKKAGIHTDAIAGLIARADKEQKQAVERKDLKKNQDILRIGVWHHAVAGPELMQDLGFLTQLQKVGMRLCLHGDVHEPRSEMFGYRKQGIDVEIIGAGSFGSEAEGRPEATPRLYNMLEVTIDPKTKRHQSIRVHTRRQRNDNVLWEGYHEWPIPDGEGRQSFYDIDLE